MEPTKWWHWFILGYIFILQSLIGSLFMSEILHPAIELYFAFAGLIVEVFMVLLAIFIALYAIVLERIWEEVQPLSPQDAGLKDYYNRCKTSAKPIITTMLIIVIGAVCITLLAQPLSQSEFIGTFGILLILQVSILGGGLFLLFLWGLFNIVEKTIKLKMRKHVEVKNAGYIR